MPTVVGDGPTVTLSFANNFWGKDDAGVGPLLLRMHAAKQTCDELKAFYTARASIEDEYARRLLSLCKKPLGSQEMGGLKLSLDTVRGEVETMAKQHQNIAAQMKSELEEPLSAFAGALKERRKIVQNTIEKLLKVKMQQTQHVNKTRDKFEQESFKIKGYLAQGHMVMGQEERKNKAKLEKTQVALAASNTEYENAVRVLEETTARWNREWKAAADKFQDLEEERLDFTKSSLWAFANLASTVCVSDDASCEKIRISLEQMDAEEDIIQFITERGTGQEIPDPPKYINFIRGDGADATSDAGDEENYSVAQFPRAVNPAFRSSSPQPTNYDPHQEPKTPITKDAPNLLTDSTPTRAAIADKQPISPTGDQEIMSPQQTRLVLRPDGPSGPPIGAIDQAIKASQEVMPVSSAQVSQQSQMSSQLQRQAPPSGQVQGSAQQQSSNRVSVDRYAGIATPAPGFAANSALQTAKRGTPPPHYEGQVQRLGAPPPAHTAKAMKEASDKYVGQTRNMFGDANYSSSSLPRSGTRHGGHGPDHRSMSPGPAHGSGRSDDHRMSRRSASPNTAPSHARSSSRVSTHNSSMNRRGGDGGYSNRPSTSHSMRGSTSDQHGQVRPGSSHVGGDMAMQLMSSGDPDYGMQLERAVSRPNSRPGTSNGSRAMGVYEGHASGGSSRQRSKSLADPGRQYSRDGRPILHFARAMYPYQAAISEELGFSKGDTLAILRHQDDGWWEAEVYNAGGRVGLVPSNYLKAL